MLLDPRARRKVPPDPNRVKDEQMKQPRRLIRLEEIGDEEPLYGELPAELYQSVERVLKRMTQLLAEPAAASPFANCGSFKDFRKGSSAHGSA